ncbi:MAG: hypothetical protein ABF382_06295 [Akkermansiaceae bacterium]
MRLIFVANCLLIVLISCGSDSGFQNSVAGSPETIAKKSGLKPDQQKAEGPIGYDKKSFAGQVTFQGLTSSQLFEIRVIPESGSELIMPGNQSYDQVDGLWVMGAKPNEWFKIPDCSEAWVGKEPDKFEGTAHLGTLKIYHRSSPILRFVGAMKQGIRHPSWVLDSGATKSPVPSPWKTNR